MIKFLINKFYRASPKCYCGYNMKPTNDRKSTDEDSWKCIWKKCRWVAFESSNGTLHRLQRFK